MIYPDIEIPETYNTNKRLVAGAWILYTALPAIFLMDLFCIIGNNFLFKLIGIPPVSRKEYIRPFSRRYLPGVSTWYKLGCMYCSYANGVAYYFQVTAMKIEFLYCPWKQKDRTKIYHHRFFKDW